MIDIYSNSWGPSDSGKIVAGLGRVLLPAIKSGINEVDYYASKTGYIYLSVCLFVCLCRGVVVRAPFSSLLLEMVHSNTTRVQLMALSAVFIPSQSVPWPLMDNSRITMSSVQGNY